MYSFKSFLLEAHSYDYSCVMYKLPNKYVKIINNWSKKHIPEKLLYYDEDNPIGREKDTHVTIFYGLHINNPEKVKNILNKFENIKIKLGLVSKFTKKHFDVIKIDVESFSLNLMNKKLKMLPHTSEYDSYEPHCTIAYVKSGSCDHLLGKKYFINKTLYLNNLVLSNSKGIQTQLK